MKSRLLVAIVAAAGIALAGPGLPRPAGWIVAGHSQLVSSVPGAGQVVAEPPTELRLVFSEPLEPRYSSIDLLDGTARSIVLAAGTPDPADPRTLVVPVSGLSGGAYSVTWRALSAADGHQTSGFFTFGVGAIVLPPGIAGISPDSAGTLHGGHDTGQAVTEVQARFLGDLGFMLALGLAMFAWAVLRPVTRHAPRRLALGQISGLVVAGVGAIAVGFLVGSAPGLGPVAYLTGSRTGELLVARLAVGVGGGLLASYLVLRGRAAAAILAGGVAGLIGLTLVALGGHAAAFTSPAPLAVIVVHLVAGSIWLGGVVALAEIAIFGPRHRSPALRRIVPRFTALALVSVALIGLTGIYSAWVETGDLTPLATPYATALDIKVTIFLAALLLGALNFADGGRGKGWIGGFGPRVALEALLGIAVVIAAGNLVSGSPPGAQRPIAIAAAPSSLHAAIGLAFEIQPGRPGPNRYWVVVPARSATGTVVELRLQRLDRDIGLSRIALQPVAGTGVAGGDSGSQVQFAVDGGLLSADSRWDATVVVKEADGSERGRERFTFALDAAGISEGRAVPRLDPTILVALALLALAIVGSAFVLGGGRVPRANPTVGRSAVLVSGMIGGALGLLLLLDGTPR